MSQEPVYRCALRSAGVSEEILDQTDSQYRALGRFHYNFTRIIFTAWVSVAPAGTSWWPNKHAQAVKRALVEETAKPAMRKWFQLCRVMYSHSKAEEEVLCWFEAGFSEYIKVRNILSHGIAFLGYGDRERVDQWYAKVNRNNEEVTDDRLNSVESMDALTDEVWYYRRRLSEYASMVFMGDTPSWPVRNRVARNLTMRNGRVERLRPLSLDQEILIGG